MKIFVCVKPVPDTAADIGLKDDSTPDLDHIPLIINPYDESAIEEAVRITETLGKGEVVLISAAGEETAQVIKSAMATGARRAILVDIGREAGDPMRVGAALASAVRAEGLPDLILTGRAAADTDGFQTAYRLAAALDTPIVTEVSSIEVTPGALQVKREAGRGETQMLTVPLPCVISVTKGINTPRYPRLPDIIKARKKELTIIAPNGATPVRTGFRITGIAPMPEKGRAEILTGDTAEQVDALIQRIAPQLGSQD